MSEYIEFIIGQDKNGKEIRHTCNPDKLSNYFGKNPNSPHYLTLVFFDPSVLSKYYNNPDTYSVEDGLVRCGYLWSIPIDNHNKDYVTAYLGDLGRDLPDVEEQCYWRGYNKVPQGKLSHTKFMRDFMAEAADPETNDLIFKNLYRKISEKYCQVIGWPLFLDLHKNDVYNLTGIRIPIHNSISEFDMLVLSLVKILIDSFNEKKIREYILNTDDEIKGGINLIERFFDNMNIQNYQSHITFLRQLQSLRSTGTGHRKGSNYEKIIKKLDINTSDYKESYNKLLNKAISFLNYINDNLNTISTHLHQLQGK